MFKKYELYYLRRIPVYVMFSVSSVIIAFTMQLVILIYYFKEQLNKLVSFYITKLKKS